MERAYYSNEIINFLKDDDSKIFGEITYNDKNTSEDLQKEAWKKQISILKDQVSGFKRWSCDF